MVTETFTNRNEIKNPGPHYNCPIAIVITRHKFYFMTDIVHTLSAIFTQFAVINIMLIITWI